MPDPIHESRPGGKGSAAEKPSTIPLDAQALPPSLRPLTVWLCWRWQFVKGRWTKPPLDARMLHKCDVTGPASLATLTEALAQVDAGRADGVGVAFAPAGLLGVDLEDCRDPASGTVTPEALATVAALDSYAEVSPSGTGVKVLVAATKPGKRCRTGSTEIYDAGRYFTLTGRTLPGSRSEPQPRQAEIDALYARLFPEPERPLGPPQGSGRHDNDDELLRVAFAARHGAKLRRLYEGDASGYSSDSEADLALCSMLAFYFRTPERVDAVYRRSGLCRAKWGREDYRVATLAKAFKGRTEFYKPARRRDSAQPSRATDGAQATADDPPEIVVGPDQGRVNDEAAEALGRAGDVYQRGGQLVQVIGLDAPSPADADIRRPAGAAVIRELPTPTLQDRLSRVARFARVVERKEETEIVAAAPPAWCVAATHARGWWPAVPRLAGVLTHPAFLPDGTVLSAAGYHAPTGLLVQPTPGLEVAVPDRPSQGDVESALALILDTVTDFPFETPAHRAAWVSGLLTPLAWNAFAGPAPLFLIDGNVRGVGKGLLADVIGLVVTGGRFPVMSYTQDAEELRKRITTLALEGERVVLLDNLTGPVGNGVLDAALTSDNWNERLLGSNRRYNGPLSLTWYATGNNCELRADTGRRTCHVRLETPDERPELKSGFRHKHLRRHVRASRGAILTAALTLLRGWQAAGRPCRDLPAWGSFEEWSDVVRACVVWTGLPDPGDTRRELLTRADRDAGSMAALLQVLVRTDPGRAGRTAGELVEAAKSDAELRAAIDDVAGRQDARSLGCRLRSFTRRVFDGLFLDRAREGGAGVRWAAYPASEFRAGDAAAA